MEENTLIIITCEAEESDKTLTLYLWRKCFRGCSNKRELCLWI